MNSPEFGAVSAESTGRIALVCLAHVEQEEALLSATLEALRGVRAALIGGDLAALAEALKHQEHTAQAGDELRRCRVQLRRDLATQLGVPVETVTLKMLANRMGGESGARLARCRERLCGMAAEIDRLNRCNASLVHHCLGLLNRILLALTGGQPGNDRYSATGRRQEGSCGCLIQARG